MSSDQVEPSGSTNEESAPEQQKGATVTASPGSSNNPVTPPEHKPLTEKEKKELEMKRQKLKQEKETRFNDNFGYRILSARWFIEEAFGEELEKTIRGSTSSIRDGPPGDMQASVRYRNPPVPAPVYDVIGDAMFTVFQKLFNAREIPVEHCHWMAYWIVHEADKKGKTQFAGTPYDKDTYITEFTEDAKKYFADSLLKTVEDVANSTDEDCDILRDKWTGLHVAAFQTKGTRKTQEDRICVYPNGLYMNRDAEDELPLLAVFDGHGGHEQSTYAAAHLWEAWLQTRKDHPEDSHADWLEKTLILLGERLDKRAIHSNWRGGSTAVVCTLAWNEGVASFAWLGDSSAFILSATNCRKVTKDHSPGDEDEKKRIEASNGTVMFDNGIHRVNGVLAVSRALGDIAGRPMISNEPSKTEVQLNYSDYLVILTSDGVTDSLSPRELHTCVQAFCLQFGVEYYQQLSDYILEEGCRASADNSSIVICFLRPPRQLWAMMHRDPDDSDDDSDDSDSDSYDGEEIPREDAQELMRQVAELKRAAEEEEREEAEREEAERKEAESKEAEPKEGEA